MCHFGNVSGQQFSYNIDQEMYMTQSSALDCVRIVMAHKQKSDFVFLRNGRVHLNRQGRQFSRLLAAEVCASAVVMLDTPCPKVVWRVLTTHSIRQFTLHFPTHASLCAITYQLDSTLAQYYFTYRSKHASQYNTRIPVTVRYTQKIIFSVETKTLHSPIIHEKFSQNTTNILSFINVATSSSGQFFNHV